MTTANVKTAITTALAEIDVTINTTNYAALVKALRALKDNTGFDTLLAAMKLAAAPEEAYVRGVVTACGYSDLTAYGVSLGDTSTAHADAAIAGSLTTDIAAARTANLCGNTEPDLS